MKVSTDRTESSPHPQLPAAVAVRVPGALSESPPLESDERQPPLETENHDLPDIEEAQISDNVHSTSEVLLGM